MRLDEWTTIKGETNLIDNNFLTLILNFVNHLRENDFTISTLSVINLFKLIPEYDLFNFKEMLITMRSLFAKTRPEYDNFENYLIQYFYQKSSDAKKEFLDKNQKAFQKEYNSLKQDLDEHSNSPITISQSKVEAENSELIERVLTESRTSEVLAPFFKSSVSMKSTDETSKAFKKALNKAMLYNLTHDNDANFNDICFKLADLYKKAENKFKATTSAKKKGISEIEKLMSVQHRDEFIEGKNAVRSFNELIKRDIKSLDNTEYELLLDYIKINASKFKTKLSRSMKVSRNKRFDFKKTIQQSIKTFGDPVELYYKKPIIKKTRLVCILDVSGSVKQYAKILLQFIYELSSVFKGGVKSYTFVNRITEVTDYMTQYSLDEGIRKVIQSDNKGYSDYNNAFKQFCDDHIGIVTKDTIVIFLGDARNNKNDSGIQYLLRIKEKARHVAWLNPENVKKWNKGDSIIGMYKKSVDAVHKATTFVDLVNFLDSMEINI